jgi:hypothetical protein
MHHGAVRGRQIGEKLGPVHLDKGNQSGTGLGYDGTGFVFLYVMKIGLYRQFRPKADIEYALNPQGLEETVEVEVLPLKTGGGSRGYDGDDVGPVFQVLHKAVKIIEADTGLVGTGADTFAASDAKLAVMIHNAACAVVTHLGGTHHNTAVAVNALIFHNMNNRP